MDEIGKISCCIQHCEILPASTIPCCTSICQLSSITSPKISFLRLNFLFCQSIVAGNLICIKLQRVDYKFYNCEEEQKENVETNHTKQGRYYLKYYRLSFTGLSKCVNDGKNSFHYQMIIKSFVLFQVLSWKCISATFRKR